jgi:hypothetical protein
MKKAFLLVTVVLIITSCKKDQVKPSTLSVFGKWELVRSYGSLPQPTEYTAGNGNMYVFKSDSTYVQYSDNIVQHQGKFSIQITLVRDSIRFGAISFTNNPTVQIPFETRSKTILFGSNIADGGVLEYRKLQ